MSYQNEEEAVLLKEEEEVVKHTSFKTSMIVVAALCALAVIGCLGVYQTGAIPSAMNMKSSYLKGAKKSMKLSADELKQQKKNTYKSFASKHSKESKGEIMNKYMEHLAISDSFAPYAYLKGKFLTAKYKTVGHGLDEDGIPDKTKPFFNIDISFFTGVYKTHYNRRDKSSLESKTLLGAFKGLDEEGNFIFVDGAYCEAEKGPSYGKLEVLCGTEFKIVDIRQKTSCEMVIKITHPIQCQKPVRTIVPTDLFVTGEEVPSTTTPVAATEVAEGVSPIDALVSARPNPLEDASLAAPAIVVDEKVLGPNLVGN